MEPGPLEATVAQQILMLQLPTWLDFLDLGPGADPWHLPQLPSFANVLPYQHYDSASQLYGLADGSIGFVMECLPQVGVSEQMEHNLQELATMLSSGVCMQVSLYSDHEVDGLLTNYCNLRPGSSKSRADSVFRQLVRRRYTYFKEISGQLRPLNYRLLLSMCLPGTLDDQAAQKQALSLRNSVKSLLDSCVIPSVSLEPAQLCQIVSGLLNPAHAARRQLGYDATLPIVEQCLLRDTEITINKDAIAVSGDGQPHGLVALTATNYPATMRLAGMQALLGDPLRSHLRYRGPFLITLCMQGLDQNEARTLVSLKNARAITNAHSVMARFMPSYYRRQQQDWGVCAEVIDSGGGLILMSHLLLVKHAHNNAEAAIENARSIWRACGFTLARCEYLQAQGLLAALPMTLTQGLAGDLRTLGWLGRKTTHNASNSLPIVAEWKGTAKPALVFVGRRGQFIGMDIYDAYGNYNVVVAGASGSGKSVLLNEIAIAELSLGAKVWVLDIGRSYQRSSVHFKGQFIRFVPDAGISLNPFTAIRDINEDMRLLKPLFAQMIAPHGQLSDYQRARLEEALLAAWERNGTGASPDAVYAELRRLSGSDSRVADMAAMLRPFTSSGVHGTWFRGAATVDFTADYVVIELEELKNNPELQLVVMLQILFLINQQIYAIHERRKLVVIDEAWDLMRGEHIGEFIEHGYRRARKYNSAFLSASQSIADFFHVPAGRAAVANSDWLMLLTQKSEELTRLVADGQLELSTEELGMVKSLHTSPGNYSEVFIRAEGNPSCIGRLAIDPFSQLLFSSKAADRTAVERYQQCGNDLVASIEAVLAERANNDTAS